LRARDSSRRECLPTGRLQTRTLRPLLRALRRIRRVHGAASAVESACACSDIFGNCSGNLDHHRGDEGDGVFMPSVPSVVILMSEACAHADENACACRHHPRAAADAGRAWGGTLVGAGGRRIGREGGHHDVCGVVHVQDGPRLLAAEAAVLAGASRDEEVCVPARSFGRTPALFSA
jgi:hypothetical protein